MILLTFHNCHYIKIIKITKNYNPSDQIVFYAISKVLASMFLCKGLRLAAVRSTASLWSYSRSLSTAQCCQQQQQQKQPANTNADGNVTPAATKPAATGSHRVTSMDRKYLVWSGKYKTAADVPEYVQ